MPIPLHLTNASFRVQMRMKRRPRSSSLDAPVWGEGGREGGGESVKEGEGGGS